MKTIHKFLLPCDNLSTIKMPNGAEILCAKTQGGIDISLWAMVETNADLELRRFFIVGTGSPVPSIDGATLKFIDTVIIFGGKLALHVFEVVTA